MSGKAGAVMMKDRTITVELLPGQNDPCKYAQVWDEGRAYIYYLSRSREQPPLRFVHEVEQAYYDDANRQVLFSAYFATIEN
jgi:predicted ATP-grasp superfamily ATP-dependent carboligase